MATPCVMQGARSTSTFSTVKLPRCAIPLYVPRSERVTNIGTGFLARRRGETGLVTAARVPIGIKPFATSGWVGWPQEILAVPDLEGPAQPVQLFDNTQGHRVPAFSFRHRNEVSGWLHDMIGFFEPLNEAAIATLEETFDVIDLEAEGTEPSKGTVLTALGYPDRGGVTTWPYSSPRRSSGAFERVGEAGLLEAAFLPGDGLVGGPVFSAKGDFVGMLAGSEDGSARILSREDLLEL